MSKISSDKHNKYLDFFTNNKKKDTEYWGIGIENESYLMLEKLITVDKNFLIKNKRERYSVDYFKNYKMDEFYKTINKLDKIMIPVYINGYLFQNMDVNGEHKTTYTKNPKINPKFNGTTIDDYIKQNNTINKLFDTNVIYDGDTIEFMTTNFYKTNVMTVVKELIQIKSTFLKEINKLLSHEKLFNDKIIYPPYNYGFAKNISNPNNLSICNNGTYHINITLPTQIKNNNIVNYKNFKNVHSNAIRLIQWFEPLLIGLYGTCDIMHCINPIYSGGSLRLAMSRYIGLGTYDSMMMEAGKKLNTFEYNDYHYFGQLHMDSPYIPPKTIGYDFNYNKFKNHGIELRIFDFFPEEYLEDIINFIILLCQYSYNNYIIIPQLNDSWNSFVIDVIKNGSKTKVSFELYSQIKEILNMNDCCCNFFKLNTEYSIHDVLNECSEYLYKNYKNKDICNKLSPNMKKINFVDYNDNVKKVFKNLLRI
jgi:hypothetical protein